MLAISRKIQFVLNAVRSLGEDLSLACAEEDGLASDARAVAELVPLLQQLVLSRIEVLRSFELLTRLSPANSREVLLSRYLGKSVNVDTKFGGYEFELSSMLSDCVEMGSADVLGDLVRAPEFDLDKLTDPRVQRSFCEALDLATTRALEEWVCRQRDGGAARLP